MIASDNLSRHNSRTHTVGMLGSVLAQRAKTGKDWRAEVHASNRADGAKHVFPVSVKGVAVQDGKVLLLENERIEWELPGGKLELGEDPIDCVVREISEEADWEVTAGPLLDCWQYHIGPERDVLIVTYGVHVLTTEPPVVSNEHKRAGLFTAAQVPDLTMPDGYKRSISTWFAQLESERASLP